MINNTFSAALHHLIILKKVLCKEAHKWVFHLKNSRRNCPIQRCLFWPGEAPGPHSAALISPSGVLEC